MTSNSVLLGESFGRACHKLRKQIMFAMARELGRDTCFRCSKKIEDIDEFSIEHKRPWRSSIRPVEEFYDLGNIAFSHLSCNSSHAYKPNKKYKDKREKDRESFKRYYERNGSEWNARRNLRRRVHRLDA